MILGAIWFPYFDLRIEQEGWKVVLAIAVEMVMEKVVQGWEQL